MNPKVLLALGLGLVVGGLSTFIYLDKNVKSDTAAQAVLAMQGKEYSVEQLPPAAARALFEVRREAWGRQNQIISGAAGEMYVQEKVKESGRDRQDVLMEVMGLSSPSEEQLKAFYEENKNRIPAPYEQVKEQIHNFLIGQDLQQKREQLTDRLRDELGMKVLLPEPEAPLTVIDTQGFPSKGNTSAQYTVVKFADYQCPHCANAAEAMDELMEDIGDKVRLVYMDFPINRSGVSRDVALGAVCADEQGKFWEYNKVAFSQQSSLNEGSKMTLAEGLGLDMSAYNECLTSDRPENKVARSEAEAERLGLTGTPAFFINGKVLQPENLADGLGAAIRKAAGIN
ncbi:thioredoxin domain-containing protein [Parendozoicomonas sp. Alg238-R29]|uniref:DsbA family protein n=1 Tax=Parendozoicomonas sp. Alg238-R29 TaxID=2993446 RepID=UPI00248F3881|nr:thioredoxin domain-containing protein [Parendozoicomonas sp. Alg238-R29]